MASLNKKILTILKENKVPVTEAADASDAQNQGGTHVKAGQYTDLGAPVVSPTQTDHPDYTKGIPSQELRRMDKTPKDDISGARDNKGKVTDSEIEKDGDGPELKPGEKIVAEEKDPQDSAAAVTESARKLLKRFVTEDKDEKDDKDSDDKKDGDNDADDKKDDVKEDTGADAENQRQYAKRSQGEPMHSLEKSKLDAPAKGTEVQDKAKPVVSEDKDDKDSDDKKDMAEDINALFAGENITEAFRKKAVTIFETAVNARVTAIVEQQTQEIAEQLETAKDEEIAEIKENLATKVDKYLNYVAEEWVKENALPIENTIRGSIAEDFIAGLKTLFEEHYIEVPDSKIDVVETLAARVEILEGKLNQQIEANAELSEANKSFVKEKVLASVTEGLTASQVDKLKTLAENVEFKDEETFKQSLGVLRESYYPKNGGKIKAQNLTEDKSINLDAPVEVETTGEMAVFSKTLTRLSEKA